MKTRAGFVSGTGALAAVLVVLVIVAVTVIAGPVAFSPGALNSTPAKAASYGGVSTHAQLSAKCEACHTPPWSSQSMEQACIGCHTEVAAELTSKSGVHGRILSGLSSPTCRGCHTEHHGPKASLTVTDPSTFPHDLTGFSLRGHERSSPFTRMNCEDCHTKDLTSFDVATCADCHAKLDAAFMTKHKASFGSKCLMCHKGKGTDLANFDHNTLPFKLTGKHISVACEKCHGSGSFQTASAPPTECGGCHAKDDKHKGSFGKQCDQCHSTSGWPGAKFDHTIFPVNHGEGQASGCKTCHPNGTGSYSCYGCHEHTVGNVAAEHRGKTAAQIADCIQCHKGGGGGGD